MFDPVVGQHYALSELKLSKAIVAINILLLTEHGQFPF